MTDDADRLAEVGRALPAAELDGTSAQRIAHAARGRLGRGPSPRRLVLPVLAAVLSTSFFVWALVRVLAALR